MDSYRLISDRAGVPELADLQATYLQERGQDCGTIAFKGDYALDPRLIELEGAVGGRCTVVRTRDGHESRKGGAVESISPVRVMLDGGGWQ